MAHLERILDLVKTLTPQERHQLRVYLERAEIISIDQTPRKRTADLFPGIRLSDDFDAELPDSFWLGE